MTDTQLHTLEIWDELRAQHPDLPVRQLADLVCSATGESYIDLIDAIRLDFNQRDI